MIKILISVLLTFLSVIIAMKLLITLNKGNLPLNMMAVTGLVVLLFTIIETRLFTKFNFKKKTSNEKDS